MKFSFIIADKCPLDEDAKVSQTIVEFDPIPQEILEYLALLSLRVKMQHKYRHGVGEFGKIEVLETTLTYKEVNEL